MASTTYTVLVNGEARETRSNKAKAVELATALRNDEQASVEVQTGAGKTVFEMAAPKRIKMSKPFTRTVEVPEGVTLPEGTRAAYVKARKGLITLHRANAEQGEQYSLFDIKRGRELRQRFATTREAGRATVNA